MVGLEAEGKYLKDTSGVRNVSNVSVYANNELIAKEHGEVQFTKYGVSGILIFQISHFAIEALRRKKKSKNLFKSHATDGNLRRKQQKYS